MILNNDDNPLANPSVVLREEFDDWAVLFDPDTGRGFGLNPTGVYLWKLLDGEHHAGTLLEKIRIFAEGVPEQAGDDVRGFIEELVREGLAGFDISQFGLEVDRRKATDSAAPHSEKWCDASSGANREAKQSTYEPPKLVHLSESAAAVHGTCGDGSGDTGSCWNGPIPGSQCGTGTLAPNSACAEGTTPAWAANCHAGSSAHRAASCGPGGTICSSGYHAGGEEC